jgi:hypothetical protein
VPCRGETQSRGNEQPAGQPVTKRPATTSRRRPANSAQRLSKTIARMSVLVSALRRVERYFPHVGRRRCENLQATTNFVPGQWLPP